MKRKIKNILFSGFIPLILTTPLLAFPVSCASVVYDIAVKGPKNVVLQNGDIDSEFSFDAINIKNKLGKIDKIAVQIIKVDGSTDVVLIDQTSLDDNYNFVLKIGFESCPSTATTTTTFKLVFKYTNVLTEEDESVTIDQLSLTYNAPQHTGTIELDPNCAAEQTIKDEGLSKQTATYSFVIKNAPISQVVCVKFVDGQYGNNLRMYNNNIGDFDTQAKVYPDNNSFKIHVGFVGTSIPEFQTINKLVVDMLDGRDLYEINLPIPLKVKSN